MRRVGIAPEVLRYQSGYLVTRFIEGESGRIDSVEEVGADAAPVPRQPSGSRGRFDAFRVVEAYRATAIEHGVPVPVDYEPAHEIAARIEQPSQRRDAAPVPQRPASRRTSSTTASGSGSSTGSTREWATRTSTWRTSRSTTSWTRTPRRGFLDAYGADDFDGLVLMRFMSDFREAMWGVVQQALSELDVDFAAYAAEHFERLARTAAEPRFRAALG